MSNCATQQIVTSRQAPAANRPPVSAKAQDALLAPFLPHIPAVRRYAGRKVAACELDDVLQDSLIRILASSSTAEILHPKSYLMMVVRAVIVDRIRQDARTLRSSHCELTEVHHPADLVSPCDVLIARQDLTQFTAALNALPHRAREMLLAVRVEGAPFKAVAERFGVCVSTVEKQVAKALAQLAAGL
jgi:RNA polymerase sigma factor (sigma-70 family)